MINHLGTPWGASWLGEVEEGVPKVGHAVKSPASYVFFANPCFVELIGSTCAYYTVTEEDKHPNSNTSGESFNDWHSPREVWVALKASHRHLIVPGPIALHSEVKDSET
jgi:hypothetical protein